RVGVTGYHNSLVDMAQWMNANLAAGSVVMVHDAGYIAYAGHFPLIDLAGLKTPAAIDVHKALTYPSAGELRPKAVAKIADLFKPSHLLVVQRWDDDYRFTDGLRAWGWMVSELYASNLSSDTPVSEAYHLYLLKPPDH